MDGKYTLTLKDNTVYDFLENGKIDKITDRFGGIISFHYDDAGRLEKVQNSAGDVLTLDYCTESGKTHLISSVTANGVTVHYIYSGVGKLEVVYTQADVYDAKYSYFDGTGSMKQMLFAGDFEQGEDSETPAEYAFAYDQDGKFVGMTDPEDGLITAAYGENTVTLTKDGAIVVSQGYNAAGDMVSREVNGVTTAYTYDENHNMTALSYPTGNGTYTEAYEYDARGNVVKFTNAMGKETQYTYAAGRDVPERVSEPYHGEQRKVTVYTYNGNDQVTSCYVQGTGQKTFYEYDTRGNCTRQSSVTGANAENLEAVPASGYYVQETLYEYDAKGRLEKTILKGNTDAENRVTTHTYETDTNNLAKEISDGVTTEYDYDSITGEVTKVTEMGASNSVVTTEYTYDNAGNVAREKVTSGSETDVTNTAYDALNRPIAVTTNAHTAQALTDAISYNTIANGETSTISVTKNNANEVVAKEISVADKDGDIVLEGTGMLENSSRTLAAGSYAGFAMTGYLRNTYDNAGQVTQSEDENGMITRTSYDLAGNKIREEVTDNSGDASHSRVTTYTYDDAGNLLTQTDPDGTVTAYTYDLLGRMLTTSVSDGAHALTTYRIQYDIVTDGLLKTVYTDAKNRQTSAYVNKLGDLVKEQNGTVTTLYTYDNAGQMLTSTLTDTAYAGESAGTAYEYDKTQLMKKCYAADHYITYTYDENGNVLTESVVDGDFSDTLVYTYDEKNNRITSAQGNDLITYTYDENDLKTGVAVGNYEICYTYDEDGRMLTASRGETLLRQYGYTNGNLTEIADGSGTVLQTRDYTWDGKPTEIVYYKADGTERERYTLSYDNADRITAEAFYRDGGATAEWAKAYAYDWQGRLISEATNGGAPTTYAYDEVGNRTEMTSGGSTLTYSYNEKDQLLTISDGSEILTRYTYDLSGNRISESNGTAATTYTYDEANQLTGVTKNGASIGAYTYDARGQRRSSGATAYLYDDLTLLAKTDSAGTEYFYYDADEEIIQKVSGTTAYDYVTDVRRKCMSFHEIPHPDQGKD